MRSSKRKKKSSLTTNVASEKVGGLQVFTINLKTQLVRNDSMEGRPYKVVPMVMLVEGVHAGSNGPLFYPKAELAKTPAVWNHKPIVVYHPTMNGRGISACDPDVLTKNKIGVIMNTTCDKMGRLKAEAWIEETRADAVDPRIMEAVNNQKMMECSTGVFTDNEYDPGEFEGEAYDYIARNYRPDHLAVLPDIKGACSMEKGAGFIRNQAADVPEKAVANAYAKAVAELAAGKGKKKPAYKKPVKNEAGVDGELSYNDIMGQLYMRLQEVYPQPQGQTPGYCCPYVENLYDEYFVFCMGGKTFYQDYSVADNLVKLEGEPSEVVRVVKYQKTDGAFVGNQSQEKDSTMNKDKQIDGLIANAASGWKETDREFLKGLPDDKLAVIVANAATVAKAAKDAADLAANEAKKKADADKAAADLAANQAAEANKAKKPMTTNEHIATLPPEVQEMVRNGLEATEAEKNKLITTITANAQNPFTKEELAGKSLKELRGLAQLAASAAPQEHRLPNYSGMGDPAINSGKSVQPALEVPTMNFDRASK